MIASFDLIIRGHGSGTFTEPEIRRQLEDYRRQHTDDPDFLYVTVIEMPARGINGTTRSVFDFVEERRS